MGAEAFGTAILVLGGVGTAVLATGDNGVGTLGVSLAFGLSLLVMAYTIGPISGCHINPAVTVGMILTRKLKASESPAYFIGQVVGAIAASGLIWFIAEGGRRPFDINPRNFATNQYDKFGFFELPQVAVAEIVLTALLVIVVLGTSRAGFAAGTGPLAAGFTLALIHLISIPIDNTSVNPVRSLGPAIMAREEAIEQVWAFIVFPLIGGVIAALVWIWLLSDRARIGTRPTSAISSTAPPTAAAVQPPEPPAGSTTV
jgi:aquaporin Z